MPCLQAGALTVINYDIGEAANSNLMSGIPVLSSTIHQHESKTCMVPGFPQLARRSTILNNGTKALYRSAGPLAQALSVVVDESTDLGQINIITHTNLRYSWNSFGEQWEF